MLTNQTPLPATCLPHRDHLGQSHVLVIAKGCWRLSTGRMAAAEQQVGLHLHPVSTRIGELELDPAQQKAMAARRDEEIVWLDHDLAPPKPAFDVIVAGYATAPLGHPGLFIDAGVRVGTQIGSMRAFAPRYWHRTWLGYEARPLAQAVQRVPVSYAFADWATGFAIGAATDANEGPALLPWIEALDTSSERRRHTRVPAGLGFWPENASHRFIHTGTYDDAWEREIAPDLPPDFNPRFYNAAHPSLQLAHAPVAGTAIRLVHLAPQAIVECSFPALGLSVQARTASGRTPAAVSMKPDTLVIEPEHDRMSVVWRVLLPASEQGDPVRTVRLFRTASAA
ncbi:DUF2169 domain-containing protein [Massilia sp. CCM 9210]|uniref:DUF2169 domain-containing protein n=1 Tax=Massilia scottii TaxID=3057166 RepID=UPI002796858E|nr:DUF2169 domain-containing protein [Massilia sp. CCM 9210]MDQ1818147.1 DUF2169 domain-containing protein [Massilia sp. CCM 9210]